MNWCIIIKSNGYICDCCFFKVGVSIYRYDRLIVQFCLRMFKSYSWIRATHDSAMYKVDFGEFIGHLKFAATLQQTTFPYPSKSCRVYRGYVPVCNGMTLNMEFISRVRQDFWYFRSTLENILKILSHVWKQNSYLTSKPLHFLFIIFLCVLNIFYTACNTWRDVNIACYFRIFTLWK